MLPDNFILYQNYPNPFNPDTKINYQLPVKCKVVIKIYNMLGQEIETLVNKFQNEGLHSILYTNHSMLPCGAYFYQIRTENYIETKKMILIK
jgi:hypothetical protein